MTRSSPKYKAGDRVRVRWPAGMPETDAEVRGVMADEKTTEAGPLYELVDRAGSKLHAYEAQLSLADGESTVVGE